MCAGANACPFSVRSSWTKRGSTAGTCTTATSFSASPGELSPTVSLRAREQARERRVRQQLCIGVDHGRPRFVEHAVDRLFELLLAGSTLTHAAVIAGLDRLELFVPERGEELRKRSGMETELQQRTDRLAMGANGNGRWA